MLWVGSAGARAQSAALRLILSMDGGFLALVMGAKNRWSTICRMAEPFSDSQH